MKTNKPLQQAQQSLFGADEIEIVPAQPAAPRYKTGTLYELPLADLVPDPEQPRTFFDEESLETLALTIRSHGVRQPVLFRVTEEGAPMLVAGERRWRAARMAGLKKIPALYVTGDSREISLIENTQREDLTAIELAEALNHFKTQSNALLQDVARIVGKAESTVSEILSLNRLPDAIKDACRKNPAVPRDILVRIARAPSREEMEKLYARYVEGETTGREDVPATLRPMKIVTLSRQFTAYAERVSTIDVAELKPAQRSRLKPIVQKAVQDLSALLSRLEQE